MARTMIIRLSRGRRLLIALLQRTTARDVAARCRVYPQRIADWLAGHKVPSEHSRRMLQANYGIPLESWDEEWEDRSQTPRALHSAPSYSRKISKW